jgi:WD40 repeat protein
MSVFVAFRPKFSDLSIFSQHCAGINCLAYLKASTSDSCDYLFSGSRDGTLKRWALKDQDPTFSGTFESHVDWVLQHFVFLH